MPERGAKRGRLEDIPAQIWVLLGATFFVAIGFGLIVPVLPQYAASFGVNAFSVSLVVSAFALMRLVTAPFAGWAVDKSSQRVIYSLGLILVAASSLASAFAGTYEQLLLFRGLGGIGSSMFTIAAAGMVIRYSPVSVRGRVSAMWGGMFLIGNIAGPALGGLLGQFGMRVPFIIYAIALAIAAVIVMLALRNPPVTAGGAKPKLPPAKFVDSIGDSAYRGLLVAGLAAGWVNFGVRNALIPLFVAATMTEEPWVTGAVMAIAAAGNVLALPIAGRGSDARGRRPYLIAGLSVSGLSLILIPFAANLALLMLICAVGGFGAGLAATAQQAGVADIVGQERSGGTVISGVQMATDIGTIVGPIVAGAIVDGSGYGWAFAASGFIACAAAVLWVWRREPRRQDDERPAAGS